MNANLLCFQTHAVFNVSVVCPSSKRQRESFCHGVNHVNWNAERQMKWLESLKVGIEVNGFIHTQASYRWRLIAPLLLYALTLLCQWIHGKLSSCCILRGQKDKCRVLIYKSGWLFLQSARPFIMTMMTLVNLPKSSSPNVDIGLPSSYAVSMQIPYSEVTAWHCLAASVSLLLRHGFALVGHARTLQPCQWEQHSALHCTAFSSYLASYHN